MADDERDVEWEIFWCLDAWHSYRERLVLLETFQRGVIHESVLYAIRRILHAGCRKFSLAGPKYESLTRPRHYTPR